MKVVARILWTKSLERPKHKNQPELVRQEFKQLNECNLTESHLQRERFWLCVMQVCDVSGLHEELMEGKGYNEITLHDVSFESASKS